MANKTARPAEAAPAAPPRRRRVVTPAMLAANRANAARSTGPRSAAGRARSARNALKHGGRAAVETPLPDEPIDAFADHLADTLAEFMPADDVEAELVRQIAAWDWRIRRVHAAQAAEAWARYDERLAAGDPRPDRVDPDVVLKYVELESRLGGRWLRAVAALLRYREARRRVGKSSHGGAIAERGAMTQAIVPLARSQAARARSAAADGARDGAQPSDGPGLVSSGATTAQAGVRPTSMGRRHSPGDERTRGGQGGAGRADADAWVVEFKFDRHEAGQAGNRDDGIGDRGDERTRGASDPRRVAWAAVRRCPCSSMPGIAEPRRHGRAEVASASSRRVSSRRSTTCASWEWGSRLIF